jgi:mono/diheme cytochrome c family protein
MKYLQLFILFALMVGTLACASKETKPAGGIKIGESKTYEASLYRQNCAICHGAEGNGKEIDGKLIPSLRYGDAAKRTDQEIYDQISHGKLPMPAFKNQLTEDEIRRMVRFIRRDLQGKAD